MRVKKDNRLHMKYISLIFHTVFFLFIPSDLNANIIRGCPRGVMFKAMDCRIVVSESVLQSRYYVHFWANTLRKGMNPLILPAMG